jgi:hypothetical protein
MMNTFRPVVELLEDRSVPTATQYINALYLDYLNRVPSTNEVQFFLNELSQGKTAFQISLQFATSDEYIVDQTRTYYATYLGRTASAAELSIWLGLRRNGLTDLQEQVAFLASNEFLALQNNFLTGWASAAFQITLKRSPDASALSYFTAVASQSRPKAASQIVLSPEALNNDVNAAYGHFLGRNADPSGSSFFTQQMEVSQSQAVMLATITSSQEYITNKASGNVIGF